jgi:hypothetical protein
VIPRDGKEDSMADTFHGEPMDITTALGDQVQVIRLGRAIGLGAIRAADDDAAMATLTPDEARQVAGELVRLIAELT